MVLHDELGWDDQLRSINLSCCRHPPANLSVETADFISAMSYIKPSAAEGKLQSAQIQEVRWTDIGGHESVKVRLSQFRTFYK